MAKAVHQSEKESYQLVTFQYGNPAAPSFALYTDWAQAVEGGFVATPSMEVDLPSNHGTFQESLLTVTMEVADAFLTRASKLLPHSPIFVKVDDVTKGTRPGDSASVLTFFRGRVRKAIKNRDGRSNMVALEALSLKSRLDKALGIPCNSHCAWTLFGFGCRADGLAQAAHQKTVTINAAVGKLATITTSTFVAPSSPGGNIDHFWDRGYLMKDGIIVSIRDWDLTDPTQVHTRRTVPPEWVGQSVLAVPGCHKTIEDCRIVWDNEGAAGHFGYGMQDYSPLFENPA